MGSAFMLNELLIEDLTLNCSDFIALSQNDRVTKILEKYVVGGFIARQGGDILFARQFNTNFHFELLSNFLSALSVFGEENVGKIKRILIEGLDLELNIIQKHGLILTMAFRPNMVKDHLDVECTRALDLFFDRYRNAIEQNRGNQAIYQSFEPIMMQIIWEYLIRINAL
jgi:hypothetical protein